LAVLSADTISTIGGTSGLTGAYISNGCSVPTGPDFNGCISGSTGGYTLVTEAGIAQTYWQAPSTGGTLIVPVGRYGQNWVSILDNNSSSNSAGGVNAFVELDFGTSSNVSNAGSIVYPLVNGVNIEDTTTSFGSTFFSIDSAHAPYYLVDVQVLDFGGGTGVAGMASGTPEPPSLVSLAIGLSLLLVGASRGKKPVIHPLAEAPQKSRK